MGCRRPTGGVFSYVSSDRVTLRAFPVATPRGRSVSFPTRGTMVTYVTWDVFLWIFLQVTSIHLNVVKRVWLYERVTVTILVIKYSLTTKAHSTLFIYHASSNSCLKSVLGVSSCPNTACEVIVWWGSKATIKSAAKSFSDAAYEWIIELVIQSICSITHKLSETYAWQFCCDFLWTCFHWQHKTHSDTRAKQTAIVSKQ